MAHIYFFSFIYIYVKHKYNKAIRRQVINECSNPSFVNKLYLRRDGGTEEKDGGTGTRRREGETSLRFGRGTRRREGETSLRLGGGTEDGGRGEEEGGRQIL